MIFCVPLRNRTHSLSLTSSYRWLPFCHLPLYSLLSSSACLGENQSALNIKYAVKRQKSLHADDGESRAVRERGMDAGEEENGHGYTRMEGKDRWRWDSEDAVRETGQQTNTHILDLENIWIDALSVRCVRCVSVLSVRQTIRAWTECIVTCLVWMKSDPWITLRNVHWTD